MRIGERYTITTPSGVREELGLREGSRLLLRVEDGKIVLEPLPDEPFEILA